MPKPRPAPSFRGDATATPKAGDGPIEAIRQLRLARNGAMKARTAAANQLHSLTDTAPDELRAKLRALTTRQRAKTCARLRGAEIMTPASAAKRALRSVASRWLAFAPRGPRTRPGHQAHPRRDSRSTPATSRCRLRNRRRAAVRGGRQSRTTQTEASFAALCGTSPVRVSSGKTNRHRLNRAGDRHANSALWTVVMVRIRSNHAPTIAYIERRTTDGLSKREVMRCLKRYVAREIYNDIAPTVTPQRRKETNIAA